MGDNTLVPGGTCDIVLCDMIYDPSCSIVFAIHNFDVSNSM